MEDQDLHEASREPVALDEEMGGGDERGMWLGEDVNIDGGDETIFYCDFPPPIIPDCSCMSSSSSSSSSSSAGGGGDGSNRSGPTAASSSASSSSWAVPRMDAEEDAAVAEAEAKKRNDIRAAALSPSVGSMEMPPPLQTLDDVECMDVMEDFGYMDLLEPNDICVSWDPPPPYMQQENNSVGCFSQEQQQQQHQQLLIPPGEGGSEESEDVGMVFLEWLKSNKESISAEDLRKIKLRRATIECAARRLGGGKEGMKRLLKLILEWVQQHQLQKKHQHNYQQHLHEPLHLSPNPNLNCGFMAAPDSRPFYAATLPPPPYFGYVSDHHHHQHQPGPTGDPLCQVTSNASGQHPSYQCCSSEYYGSVVDSTLASSWSVAMGSHCCYAASFPDSSNNSKSLAGTMAPPLPPQPRQIVAFGAGGGYQYAGCNQFYNGEEEAVRMGGGVGASAATTKEARKKRMARQRRFLSHHNHHHRTHHQQVQQQHNFTAAVPQQEHARVLGTSTGSNDNCAQPNTAGNWVYWSPPGAPSAPPPPAPQPYPVDPPPCMPVQNFQRSTTADRRQGGKTEKNLRFLLQKVLKQSDVGNLGRIVLPKKEAEIHLPELSARDGISIAMEDIGTSRVWNMRYRFWPNNKSRMYLLENTGDFVRSNGLQEGDFIVIYSDLKCGKYMIRGVKVRQQGPETKKSGKAQRNNHHQHASSSPVAANNAASSSSSPPTTQVVSPDK